MAERELGEVLREALAAYLQDGLDSHASIGVGGVVVVADYPDSAEGQSTSEALVSVSCGEIAEEAHPPVPRSATTAAGVVTTIEAIATWSATVQIDLWTRAKDQRDELVPVIRGLLSPSRRHPLLRLVLDDHYEQVVLLRVTSSQVQDDDAAYAGAEWAWMWEIEATGSIVRAVEDPELLDPRAIVTAAADITIDEG